MYSIILCGGSGTRLWPLSRKNFPKQFLKLYSDHSLLQETFFRAQKLMPSQNIFLITNQENYFNAYNQIREIYPKIKKNRIIIEPDSRNTGPAIALAVKYLKEKIKISDSDPIISLHSDHYIGDDPKFVKILKSASRKINNKIGAIGIVPDSPKINYGYIKMGEKRGDYHLIKEFKEKPDLKTAKKYLKSGSYLWNSGIYLFNIKTFEQELEKHAPDIYEFYRQKWDKFLADFRKIPETPIDVAVSEKSKEMIVFLADFDWSDIGLFDSMADIVKKRKQEQKRHVFVDSKNIFAHSSSNRLIATLGVEDLVIIENNGCILIQKKGYSDKVKKITDHLKKNQYDELEHNITVYRPWGKYEVLIDEPNYKVKKITVFPKSSLSLQSHNHRSEHWIVVKGFAKIINNDKELRLTKNQSTYIPAGAKHRLMNPYKKELEIIEVQSGDYLKEDDIVRFDDKYKRESI